jgi:hypothetical protein
MEVGNRRRLAGLGFGFLIGLVGIGGCTSGATPSAPVRAPTASASVAATASAVPASASPSAAPSLAIPAATLCAGGQMQDPCELQPGTYSADPFQPGFMFTITEPWTNDRRYADGGGISLSEAAIFWASGVSAGTVDGTGVAIEPGPAGFLAFLAKFEGFTLSEPGTATVDGVSGIQVDVETKETAAPQIFEIQADFFNLDAGEKARFILLDKDGTTVIFIIDAFKEAGFDAFLVKAQPVLDSVTWE